jgi:hypothetical protein
MCASEDTGASFEALDWTQANKMVLQKNYLDPKAPLVTVSVEQQTQELAKCRTNVTD